MNITMGVGNLRQVIAFEFRPVLCLSLALLALLLCSNQPAMAQFKIINVKNAPYFAKGDGITDDSVALQQAVDAATASPGSTVYFPVGTYLHSSDINVNGNRTTLRGQNRAQTILTGGRVTVFGSGTTINSLSTSTSAPYNVAAGTKVAISNCTIGGRVSLTNSDDCQISNCEFVDNSYQIPALSITGCNRVAVSNCQLSDNSSSGQQTSFLVNSSLCNDLTFRQSKFVISGGVAINLDTANRALIESCSFESVRYSYQIGSRNCNSITVRNNSFTQTATPTAEGFCWFGLNDLNTLASNNKFTKLEFPIYWTSCSGQITGNSIQDSAYGILLYSSQTMLVNGNNILRSSGEGIYSYALPGYNLTFQRNILRDCGLSQQASVIVVLDDSGGNQANIQQNIYTGNQQNLQYFIRCEIPAPPAVVRGNITTTMLPTLVGP